ncbi:hypothetical protein IFM89_030953, partial [Coptis chinensis]
TFGTCSLCFFLSHVRGFSNLKFMVGCCSFLQDTRPVYKHYATLYFVFVFDDSENELAMLDLIQVFVETLDKCFRNVCELDIVFNFSKMHMVLNEIIFGGQVLETSATEVMKAVEEITKCALLFPSSLPHVCMFFINQFIILLYYLFKQVGEGLKCNLSSPQICFELAELIKDVLSQIREQCSYITYCHQLFHV